MKRRLLRTTALSIALCSAMGTAAVAETQLIAKDGSFVLNGTIQNATEDSFTIRTEMGEITIRRSAVNCEGDFCSEDDFADQPDQVHLTSDDGKIDIQGELLAASSTTFTVRTVAGDVEVDRTLVTCEGTGCPTGEERDITRFALIGPSSGGAPLLNEVVKGFTSRNGYQITESFGADGINLLIGDDAGQLVSDIKVAGLPTPMAVQQVLAGKAAFAITVFPATPEMLTELTGREVTAVNEVLDERIVGIDALVVVTNPANPVKTMTVSDVGKVLSGGITNWSELGGPDLPITLHLAAESMELDDRTQITFLNDVPASSRARLYPDLTPMKAALSADVGGFGTYYRSQARGLQQVELVGDCKIHYGSSNFSVQSNEYPFFINVYSYQLKGGSPVESVNTLLDYVATDEGQSLMTRIGLVPQVIQTERMKDQGERLLSSVISTPDNGPYNSALHKYLAASSTGTRLSTSLRFVTGSAELDTRGVQDIERISDYIRQSANQGLKFTVVGFSDSQGSFARNIELSEGRAEAIKQELLAKNSGFLDPSDIEVLGAGPIAPVDCNDTERGRQLNRRVEIWVSPKR